MPTLIHLLCHFNPLSSITLQRAILIFDLLEITTGGSASGLTHSRQTRLAAILQNELGPVNTKMAGWREEALGRGPRRKRGNVAAVLLDRVSNAAHLLVLTGPKPSR